ncbi:hypothetical protein BDV59DRAFT_185809 [Aspergillus ambiguus]|uniref:uncharacterized protein n=1 Tax=Aspergillus ambiguus TaxID=176160 RepID=UPI003CCD8845
MTSSRTTRTAPHCPALWGALSGDTVFPASLAHTSRLFTLLKQRWNKWGAPPTTMERLPHIVGGVEGLSPQPWMTHSPKRLAPEGKASRPQPHADSDDRQS